MLFKRIEWFFDESLFSVIKWEFWYFIFLDFSPFWCNFRKFTWQFYLENLLDNLIRKIYLTILFEKFTWQFYLENLLDNFIWKIYLTILIGKFTWQNFPVNFSLENRWKIPRLLISIYTNKDRRKNHVIFQSSDFNKHSLIRTNFSKLKFG